MVASGFPRVPVPRRGRGGEGTKKCKKKKLYGKVENKCRIFPDEPWFFFPDRAQAPRQEGDMCFPCPDYSATSAGPIAPKNSLLASHCLANIIFL